MASNPAKTPKSRPSPTRARGLVAISVLLLAGCVAPANPNPSPESHATKEPLGGSTCDNVADHQYGAGRIQQGSFAAEGDPARRPWSSYWYANSSRFLFDKSQGQPGPFQKYDEWVKRAHPSEDVHAAVTAEKDYKSELNSQGLCTAWAVASLLEAEPKAGKKLKGVEFGVGDLKALLIQTYENLPDGVIRTFTQSCGGRQQDLSPDQFHRVLQAELLQGHHSFLVNNDPGIQNGNFPVFRGVSDIRRDPQDVRIFHVTTRLTAAAYLPDPSFFPNTRDTVGTQEFSLSYTYDLRGEALPDGGLAVKGGEWTGDSRTNHPVSVSAVLGWSLPTDKRRGTSRNAQIKTPLVNDLLDQKPDSLLDSILSGILHSE